MRNVGESANVSLVVRKLNASDIFQHLLFLLRFSWLKLFPIYPFQYIWLHISGSLAIPRHVIFVTEKYNIHEHVSQITRKKMTRSCIRVTCQAWCRTHAGRRSV